MPVPTTLPKSLLTLTLAALALGGAALTASAPARAADYGYDEEAGFRPRVERRIVEERRVEERRIVTQTYGPRHLGSPIDVSPVGFGYSGYGRPPHFGYRGYPRPAFYGHPGFGGAGCRLIVKKRVDPWGDVMVKRIRICD